MKLPLFWPALFLAAAPTALLAQSAGASDEGDVTVNGQVAPICVLGEPTDKVINLGTLIDTSGPHIGRIAAISPRTVTMPASFCNYANTSVSISATALLEQGGAPLNTGFARAVNYRVAVTPWATTDALVTTNAAADGTTPTTTGASATQPQPKLADLTMQLSNFSSSSDSLLVAGNYAGVIVVTLGPAVTN